MQCDEDAIRRALRITSVYQQTKTIRLFSRGWGGHWRRRQPRWSQCFITANNRRRLTCTPNYVFKARQHRENLWFRKQIFFCNNRSRITWSIIKLASMYRGTACKIAITTITASLCVYSVYSWRAGGYTCGRLHSPAKGIWTNKLNLANCCATAGLPAMYSANWVKRLEAVTGNTMYIPFTKL